MSVSVCVNIYDYICFGIAFALVGSLCDSSILADFFPPFSILFFVYSLSAYARRYREIRQIEFEIENKLYRQLIVCNIVQAKRRRNQSNICNTYKHQKKWIKVNSLKFGLDRRENRTFCTLNHRNYNRKLPQIPPNLSCSVVVFLALRHIYGIT